MNTFNRWMTMFEALSPVRQILLVLGLGCVLANGLATLFFRLGGYDSLNKSVSGRIELSPEGHGARARRRIP
jgi:hypothetical protein